MITNIELKRTHDGKLEMFVSGIPALNSCVTQVNNIDGELMAVVLVPLKDATIGERDNVLPFRTAA